jgi:hypothetical protein
MQGMCYDCHTPALSSYGFAVLLILTLPTATVCKSNKIHSTWLARSFCPLYLRLDYLTWACGYGPFACHCCCIGASLCDGAGCVGCGEN